jgi:hypothetical protein
MSVRTARSCAGALRGLQPVQGLEQRLERPGRQRLERARGFVPGEGFQAVALVHRLRLVGKKHRVAVESDAHLPGMAARGLRRLRVDARGGAFRLERAHDVALVRRQEKIRLERVEIAVGAASAGENPALELQPGSHRGAEYPQAGDRVVLGEDHHLDALRLRGVEGEELLHQGEGDTLARRHVEARELQRDVGRLAVALEHPVFLLEIEKRARGDRDHELAFDRVGHRAPLYR